MKAIIKFFFLFCLTLLFSFSCNSKIESVAPEISVDLSLIREVENLPNNIVSVGYDQLNTSEQLVFWDRQQQRFLRDNQVSDALRKHISLLSQINTLEVRNSLDTPRTREFIDNFTKTWFVDPVKKGIFSRDDLLQVATLFGAGKSDLSLEKLNARVSAVQVETENDCNCIYDLGCQGWSATCNTGSCSSGSSNCGILGSSNCQGKCSGPM